MDSEHWLEEFRLKHGRSPRVLHVGNIANNAYVYSKILNRAGLWSDVLCYDYYHIMGCPEWEESDYRGDILSDFYPAWEQVDLRGYQRPRWFAQGPAAAGIEYLVARCEGRPEAEELWQSLGQQRDAACDALRAGAEGRAVAPRSPARQAAAPAAHRLPRLRRLLGPAYPPLRAAAWGLIDGVRHTPRRVARLLRRTAVAPALLPLSPAEQRFRRRVAELCSAYAELFPERASPLRPGELENYRGCFEPWKRLIRCYDAVIGYSTDGIYPLLANACPYLALEHGTIRNIPFQDTAQGKLCALTYRLAAHALITNCDNMEAADRLRLPEFRFLPHPINEDLAPTVAPEALRAQLRDRLGCDFLVFHPSRHHWTAERHPDWEKGNDVLIEGVAAFRRQSGLRVGAVFVDWGQKVAESRALLEKLGLGGSVLWIPPQPIPRMLDYVRACDVLADQFYLGAFGSITPKAWMLGVPTLLYLNEGHHRRCFPVLPPVINARTPAEVCAGLCRLHGDPAYAQHLRAEGLRWYRQFHSNEVILVNLLETLHGVLAGGGGEAGARAGVANTACAV